MKVDVNEVDRRGMTPLMTACWHGHKEVVEFLVKQNEIDLNKKCEDPFHGHLGGKTALELAEEQRQGNNILKHKDYDEIIKILERSGAKR
jgi:ankyrin repeat protein